MSIPMYTTVIEKFMSGELDPILKNFVFNGYSTLVSHLRVPLGLAVVLFIILLGISISQGWVKLTVSNFVKSTLKIGLIYMFAMNWGVFSEYVVNGIGVAAGQLGDFLIDATPIPLPHFAGSGINGALQSVLIEFTKIGAWIWGQGSWHTFSPYFTASLIWFVGYIMIIIAVFEIVVAKIMLAILFVTAPLFISFTLFKPTHGFFDRWLGAIAGYAFLLIFVSAMLGLALTFAQWAIGGMYLDHALHISLVGFVPVIIVCGVGIGIILKSAALAQSIGGTVTTTSGSMLLAGAVGGAIGAGMGSLRFASKSAGAGRRLVGVVSGIRNRLRRGE